MKKINSQPNYLVPSLVILILVSGTSFIYSFSLWSKQPTNQVTDHVIPIETITNVSARGRIQPQNEVIKLSASPTLEGAKIAQLLVKTGDRVEAEQIIAILDNYPRLLATIKQAETQIAIKRANLAKVEAGAKSGEIEAQKALINVLEAQLEGTIATQQAKITRLETQLQGEAQTQRAKIEQIRAKMSHAQAEYERYQSLYLQGAIPVSGFDTKRTEWETAAQELQEAQANLTKTITVIEAKLEKQRLI